MTQQSVPLSILTSPKWIPVTMDPAQVPCLPSLWVILYIVFCLFRRSFLILVQKIHTRSSESSLSFDPLQERLILTVEIKRALFYFHSLITPGMWQKCCNTQHEMSSHEEREKREKERHSWMVKGYFRCKYGNAAHRGGDFVCSLLAKIWQKKWEKVIVTKIMQGK